MPSHTKRRTHVVFGGLCVEQGKEHVTVAVALGGVGGEDLVHGGCGALCRGTKNERDILSKKGREKTCLVEDAHGGRDEDIGVDVERAWVGAGGVGVLGGRGRGRCRHGGGGQAWAVGQVGGLDDEQLDGGWLLSESLAKSLRVYL